MTQFRSFIELDMAGRPQPELAAGNAREIFRR
jgi:hypothetical protein